LEDAEEVVAKGKEPEQATDAALLEKRMVVVGEDCPVYVVPLPFFS
jgi:hypothetical protein